MQIIDLAGGLRTTRLGLGCAPILGRVSAEQGRSSILAALDAGIRHFDTAPSYGYGQGEEFLGEVLHGARIVTEVTIATKVGLAPRRTSLRLMRLKPLLRTVIGQSRISARLFRSVQSPLLEPQMEVSTDQIRRSVHRSLLRLHRDELDVVLLHRLPGPGALRDDAVASLLALADIGVCRAVGVCVASGEEVDYARNLPLIQGPYPVIRDVARVRPQHVIAHSVFPSPGLASALEDLPDGVIVCSMFSEGHMSENVSVVEADAARLRQSDLPDALGGVDGGQNPKRA